MAYNPSNTNYGSRNTGYAGSQKSTAESTALSPDDKTMIKKIICEDDTAAELVKFADNKADRLVRDNLTTSQLRNIFGEFRKIEAFWEMDPTASQRRLRLLQPKLAYQQKREPKTEHFCAIMTEAIEQVFNSKDIDKGYRNCMNLMEAIVAYHKNKGGKD